MKHLFAWAACFAAVAPVVGETAPARPWSVGPIDFSGVVDVFYSLNFNHPASRVNQFRNFDD